MSNGSGGWKGFLFVMAAIAFMISNAVSAHADAGSYVPIYQLYNGTIGEFLFTGDSNERTVLVNRYGWTDEGIGLYAPNKSNTPVYRLYNPDTCHHYYTTKNDERKALISKGWIDEGIGWYSDEISGTALPCKLQPSTGQNNSVSDQNKSGTIVKQYGGEAAETAGNGLKGHMVHHAAVTHEEPVYKTERVLESHEYCNNCGKDITGHVEDHIISGCDDGYHCGRWTIRDIYVDKSVQTGTRTVTDQEAYDEWIAD